MKNTDNKKFWQKTARLYDFSRKTEIKAYEKMYEKIKGILNTSMNVLEIASGTGLISAAVADNCKHIEATDFSEKMIEQAKRKHNKNNLSFAVQDATKLTYKSNTFDAVIIANALHIMPYPEKALENIKRVLKDDGILIAPNYVFEGGVRETIQISFLKFLGYKNFSEWTRASYSKFIRLHGWRITDNEIIKGSIKMAFITAVSEK